MREKLSRKALYPVWQPYFASLGLDNHKNLKARWTGEKRPPRRGEYFLSGAVIEAYKAENDLTTPYHIAELVEIETKTVQIVKRVVPQSEIDVI